MASSKKTIKPRKLGLTTEPALIHTAEESGEINQSLENFARLLADIVLEDFERQKKLKSSPKGAASINAHLS